MSRRLLFRLLASVPPGTNHVPDAELLHRFATENDPSALELLVRRHADAVWAAARRLSRCEADAEDAFQAAFLALIRGAGQVRAHCVGAWLHRVAVNAALHLRRLAARANTAPPDQFTAVPAPVAEPLDADRETAELARALHEELARLSERERLPVVLCDLEGLTHADAAKTLGWPIGTVSGRLSRARAKLRARLAGRGLAPSAVVLPAAVCPARLIPTVLSLTTGAVPPAVVTLAEGVLAMNVATWKWVAVVVLCSGAAGTGVVLALGPGATPAGQTVAPANAPVAARHERPAKEPAVGGNWTPKELGSEVPTAFPNLKPPADTPAEVCPRIWGKQPIAVAETDTTAQRLLKARINQYCLALSFWPKNHYKHDTDHRDAIQCQTELIGVLVELWPNEVETRTPWLEEILVYAKFNENLVQQTVKENKSPRTSPVSVLTLAALTRHRLMIESTLALWKAKAGK